MPANPLPNSTQQLVKPASLIAGATLVQGDVVKFQADGKVDPTAATTDQALGVALSDALDTEAVDVQTTPGAIVECVAGAAISVGDLVMPSGATAGQVLTRTATNSVVGTALTAAALIGESVQVLFNPRFLDV